MYLLLAVIAALSYTIGGVFMKFSEGFTHPIPSLLVYLLFLLGASLQIYITNNAHLGVTYILVLGLETVCALLFSLIVFREGYSTFTLIGILFVVLGAAFLRAEAG